MMEARQPNEIMGLKDWIITIILLFIPVVNLVMLIIWATDKQDARNVFAKAYLIVTGCFVAVTIIFYVFIFILFFMLATT